MSINWAETFNPEKKKAVPQVGPVNNKPVDVSGGPGSNTFQSPVGTLNYGPQGYSGGQNAPGGNAPGGQNAPAAPKYEPYKLDRQEFANVEGVPQQILDLRQRALGGLSSGEQNAMRGSAIQNIQGTTRNLQNTLGRNQARQGVRGGIAFAQGEAIRKQALDARAGSERNILLRDADIRRQALNDLQGYVGKERYGAGAENLAEAQINMQGQAGFDQRQILNRILEDQQAGNAAAIAKEKGSSPFSKIGKQFSGAGIKNFADRRLNPVNATRDFIKDAPGFIKRSADPTNILDPKKALKRTVQDPIDWLRGKRW